jgi:CheY-like chemotaxis protein
MKAEDDILIVDDEIPNLKLLTGLLEREGYAVRPAELPQMAVDSALAKPPLLILMDVKMPKMSGFEVCRLLKQDERTRDIPTVTFRSSLSVHCTMPKIESWDSTLEAWISSPSRSRNRKSWRGCEPTPTSAACSSIWNGLLTSAPPS